MLITGLLRARFSHLGQVEAIWSYKQNATRSGRRHLPCTHALGFRSREKESEISFNRSGEAGKGRATWGNGIKS